MKFIYKLGLSLGVILYSSISLAANCDSTCQLKQIQYYFSALDKISRKGSSIKDIDPPFALTHDDVKFIHVEYEANFDKESWRKAFI